MDREVEFVDKRKKFLIVQQGSKRRGLFSLIAGVVSYLDYADRHGMIPVVDFKNFRTVYNEQNAIQGVDNAFEYYFEPVSPYSLDDVYLSESYEISQSGFPPGYEFNLTPALYPVYNKYIHLRQPVRRQVEMAFPANTFADPVLGVQFRGGEMRTAAGHPFPPTPLQMIRAIDKVLSLGTYKTIFLSTEQLKYTKLIDRAFPGLVFWNENYMRSNGRNIYDIYPRAQHRYRLGLEVLVDMFHLARCKALISCSSNVAAFARFVAGDKIDLHLFIDNGLNSYNPLVRRIQWFVMAALQRTHWGFKSDDSSFKFPTFYRSDNIDS